jgi:hypothetical protein
MNRGPTALVYRDMMRTKLGGLGRSALVAATLGACGAAAPDVAQPVDGDLVVAGTDRGVSALDPRTGNLI